MAGEGDHPSKPQYTHVVNLGAPIADEAVSLYKADGLTKIDPATEQKQDSIKASIDALAALDFATETTLAALAAAFTAEDFATETTQLGVKAAVESIDVGDIGTATDSEATGDGSLIAITKRLRTILSGTDFATEATLQNVATEATLQGVATQATLDAFKSQHLAEADETQSKLDAVNTTLGTPRQETGHGSIQANPTWTQPITLAHDVVAGNVYTAGATTDVAAAANGDLALENPSGSGKTITVVGFSARTELSSDALNVTFIKNPATVTGGTVLTPINHNFGSGNTSAATVTSGQNVATGGTVLDAAILIERDDGYQYSGPPFIIPAGTTLVIRVETPLGVGTNDVNLNVTWKES